MHLKSGLKALRFRSRVATAETIYLNGPATLRVRGKLLVFEPIDGKPQTLHPKTIRRIVVVGYADVSGVAFGLLWRHKIEVVFVSPTMDRVVARVSPGAVPTSLTYCQYNACQDPNFGLDRARDLIAAKSVATQEASRYYQRQGRAEFADQVTRLTKKAPALLRKAESLNAVRGIEGSIAAAWWKRFRSMIDPDWSFRQRQFHPAPDPVNAMLSFGYTLLLGRADTLLTVAGLDVRQGFLHTHRPGRASLACDVIEPFRIPVVDRTVVKLLRRRQVKLSDFDCHEGERCSMSVAAKNQLVNGLEERLAKQEQAELIALIERTRRQIRDHAKGQSIDPSDMEVH
ncbi:CRISPR-associated endonuclease Cas1 [Aporhodopirellula aestuarii]|uniref:CRISPR-associated endonuclease Cas1 n=1 Tax=Aporhodopirellula aestuarii TaxID=2950107 RepID=A0ABT0UCC4_9BACT|nr:CRISPR-associated endonuclease Cas1 [Aporhodopirellula aestuarii]MCM2374436.1 CRISPR-associated endonuclease Cas1 [Aporhodopirellula aestuarii]